MSLGYKNPQKKHEFLKQPSRGSGDTKLQDHACLILPFLQFCFPGVCSRSQQTADMQPIALIALVTQTIVADPHHTQFNRGKEGLLALLISLIITVTGNVLIESATACYYKHRRLCSLAHFAGTISN